MGIYDSNSFYEGTINSVPSSESYQALKNYIKMVLRHRGITGRGSMSGGRMRPPDKYDRIGGQPPRDPAVTTPEEREEMRQEALREQEALRGQEELEQLLMLEQAINERIAELQRQETLRQETDIDRRLMPPPPPRPPRRRQ